MYYINQQDSKELHLKFLFSRQKQINLISRSKLKNIYSASNCCFGDLSYLIIKNVFFKRGQTVRGYQRNTKRRTNESQELQKDEGISQSQLQIDTRQGTTVDSNLLRNSFDTHSEVMLILNRLFVPVSVLAYAPIEYIRLAISSTHSIHALIYA